MLPVVLLSFAARLPEPDGSALERRQAAAAILRSGGVGERALHEGESEGLVRLVRRARSAGEVVVGPHQPADGSAAQCGAPRTARSGRRRRDRLRLHAPELSFGDVSGVGLLIAEEQEGTFRLELRSLTAR